MAEAKKADYFKIIVSLLKKDKKVSFITLSKELGISFGQIKDLISVINMENLIKINCPVIGAPYITIE